MANSPNPALITDSTLLATPEDNIFSFSRTVRQDQEVLIEVQSGTVRFAVGEDSNNGALYVAGDKTILTIGPKPEDKLHYSAASLTATFTISF